ncbi:MAG TPA: YfhO family protein [Candidatus Binatia bacterium]|nr:YfhO family protein [Candidatus Binatia bacterium]
MNGRDRSLALGTALAAAAYVIAFRLGEERPSPLLAHDIYAEFYPNILYGLASVRDGGRGLLWNPFQNCGQPFFGMSDTGLLYPPNLLFLVLNPGRALRGVFVFNLVIAGFFTYVLCRELGVGRLAALGGALTFELGNACIGNTLWTPMAAGPFVWLPAALLCCERLLRRPSPRVAAALGGVVAVALLPGYPQPVLFICQLLALRVLWELGTGRLARPVRFLALFGLGLVLAPLLAGVQFVPALEVARESVRSGALALNEMSPQGFLGWQGAKRLLSLRSSTQPLILSPCLVAAAAFVEPGRRRLALFHLVAGTIFFVLALGPSTPLFTLYAKLPLGRQFHDPERFLWMTSFSLAILVALGLDAVDADVRSPRASALAALVGMIGVVLFFLRFGGGLRAAEWALAGLAVAACVAWSAAPGGRRVAAAGLLVLILLNLVAAPSVTWLSLLSTDASLFAHARLVEQLRARMTPQERVYLAPTASADAPPFGLMQKTASLFRLPSIFDYQPEVVRRYAEFFVMLRRGQPMASLNDVLFAFGGWFPAGFNRRLLDLTASRYVVASAASDVPAEFTPMDADDHVRVYRNPAALPRAFYVPRVEVVTDRTQLLGRLAFGPGDLRRLAFLETPPPSGFTGAATDGADGAVAFLRSDPERVTIDVEASEHGFLVLSDTYFPGWRATVDGVASPILRANHAFRLVEVPAGRSTVDFRYAPRAIWLGALISAVTVVAVALVCLSGRAR